MNGIVLETERERADIHSDRHSAVDVTNGSGERRWDNESDRLSTYPATDRSCLLKSHAAKSAECGQQSPRARRVPRESRRVSLAQASGYVQLNQYRLLEPIGQGSYGIVKLAYNEEDDTHYAMKILSKRKLMRRAGLFGRTPPRRPSAPPPDPLQRVYREIAVLKKLDHPNVVKLVEVLDDPAEDQLYLVFQLLEGGPVIDIPTDAPLSEGVARKYFRDALLGVEYLHYQRIAHRDIKPANLLLGEDRVQVADLGACGELAGGGGRLSGAVGTPAFRAPEATAMSDDYCGEAADIWSLGITLFAMVTGRVPWVGATSLELQRKVITEPLTFPPRHQLSKLLRHLLSRMLDKEPSSRANMQEIKDHPWVTCSGLEPLPSEQENCRLVEVTEEDMARVVTSIPNLSTLILIKTMLKKHSFQNPFVRSREGSARRESVSARGECARAARTPLARAGRSLSAPGNYLTEREASFDVALESVDEIRDQSQDFSSKDISLDQLDSSVDTNDTTVTADTKTSVHKKESDEKTEETQKSQTSSQESKPTNLSNDSSQSIISDKSIDSDKTAKDTFPSKYVNASSQTVNNDGCNSSSKSSSTQTVPIKNNSRHRSENSVVGAGRSSSSSQNSSCTVNSSSRSTGASNSGSSLTGADNSGSNVTEGSSCSSDSAIGSSKR